MAQNGKKKAKGLRRNRVKNHPPHPPGPQVWLTMMWHIGLRLPWTWRLGPSNSSERAHVKEMLKNEEFPEKTLFCGDAGFVGYDLWRQILEADAHFLIRVGANVKLLSEVSNVKRKGGGIVICWPKDAIASGRPPLQLRLVKVRVGKTDMWLLTSVLAPKQLPKKSIVKYYEMRWGIEVEFRGLKQTNGKRKLQCRNSNRALVELEWALIGMATAKLFALREQIASAKSEDLDYDTKELSLAKTMRALQTTTRNLASPSTGKKDLIKNLQMAKIYRCRSRDKRARFRHL